SGQVGLPVGSIESVPTEGVRVAFLGEGESRVELLEPLDPSGPVGRFVQKRGEGFHHLCFAVEDIEAAVGSLLSAGVRTVGQAPRPGAGGRRVTFLDPKDTFGVLIELSEARAGRRERVRIGETVVAYLQNPKERFWGILRDVAAWGITVEGIDLSSFDSWLS